MQVQKKPTKGHTASECGRTVVQTQQSHSEELKTDNVFKHIQVTNFS